MGRAPCCDKASVKKGPWSPEEDAKLKEYIEKHGTGGNWIALPQKAGLRRCGKSCRLRWLNYLRPNIKHGDFSDEEDRIICSLFATIGSRWSIIASQLPGRTDNDIKNYWNTKLKKKLMGMANSSQKRTQPSTSFSSVSVLDPSSLTSSPGVSSPRSAYTCSDQTTYCTTPVKPFTGYENFSIPSNVLTATTSCSSLSAPSVLQAQEGYMNSMQNYHVQDNFFRFGGEASSSSSDGSSAFDYGASNGENVNLQSYFCNGIEENQKFMFNSHGHGHVEEKGNGSSYVETPLECSLEEIKQLISTNLCNNFLVDEIKTEDKVTYY